MSRFFLAYIILLLCCNNNEATKRSLEGVALQTSSVVADTDTCIDFNSLNNKIRDGLILKQEALKQIQIFLPKLKEYFYKHGGQNSEKSNWIFPVQGYSSKAIGGTNGSGFVSSGYNYFDGNKHGGHPAHDIFILDKNQDCIDDITKKPVNVLSMTSGIVIATETDWDTTSNLRGGKYIWIYDPHSNSFFYYGHNNNVFVQPCAIVNSGDTIATVGRTGLNAFKKRSPSHLHFMQLHLDSNFYPKPIDCYNALITSKH